MALSFLYLAFTNILQLIRLRNRDCDELALEVVNSSTGEAPACAASVYVLGMTSRGNPPAAVLLDAGGVFVLPDPNRILGAFVRAECSVSREVLTDAHYRAAVRFGTHVDVEANWSETWLDYLQTYVAECGVPPDWREEAHLHIDSEFADAALWVEPVP